MVSQYAAGCAAFAVCVCVFCVFFSFSFERVPFAVLLQDRSRESKDNVLITHHGFGELALQSLSQPFVTASWCLFKVQVFPQPSNSVPPIPYQLYQSVS